jgi:hypothetical protein
MGIMHVLALLAGALNVYAVFLYNRDVFVAATKPNAAAWLIWAVVTAVQALSYHAMEDVHCTELVVMVTDGSLCAITFGFLLAKGKFGSLDAFSWKTLALSSVAIVVWQLTGAIFGNALSQIPYAMAFLPVIRDMRSGKTIDDPRIWAVFTGSFVLNLVVVCIKQPDNGVEYLFPIVAIVMHLFLVWNAHRGQQLYKIKVA